MKHHYPILMAILAVVIATFTFAARIHKEDDDIDKVERSIATLKTQLRAGSQVYAQMVQVRPEMEFWLRYALAPAYVAYTVPGNQPLLTVCPVRLTDSVTTNMLAGRTITWQYKDPEYTYLYSR